eukprot:UN20852
MYQAKSIGRDRIQFFTPALSARISNRLSLENELREAVEKISLFSITNRNTPSRPAVSADSNHWLAGITRPAGYFIPKILFPSQKKPVLIDKIGEWGAAQSLHAGTCMG